MSDSDRDDASPATNKKPYWSNPNVSSLTSNDLLSRTEFKKSRRPGSFVYTNKPNDDQQVKAYYSADNIHGVDAESSHEAVVRTLERLNMTPANIKQETKASCSTIPRIIQSLTNLLDDSTAPTEFNHVREDMIMQKITDKHLDGSSLNEKDDVQFTPPSIKSVIEHDAGDIQHLLSLTHKSRELVDPSSTVKSMEMSHNTPKQGLLAKFKKKLFNSGNHGEESERVDYTHTTTDWSQLVPDPKKYVPKPYSWGTIQRLKKLKVIYNQMKDPQKGLKYISSVKGSNSKYVKEFFTADQLISWLQEKIERDFSDVILDDTLTDALTIGRLLFHLGYIVSVDRLSTFSKGDYIFQAPFFLPSEIGSPSNVNYARYLLRRSYNSASKYKLLPWEVTNLDMLGSLLSSEWRNIEKQADKDLAFLSRQGKMPSRIFKLQEQRFWSVQRSMPDTCEIFLDEESLFLRRQRLTWADYEFSTNYNFILEWNEKKVNQLKHWQNLRLSKMSVVSTGLVDHCSIMSLIDPFVVHSYSANNPWVIEDESLWDETRPISSNEIKFWKSGLHYIILDKRGLDLFWKFCKKEFSDENLKFITSCIELDKSPTMQIFDQKAKFIYLEYIKQGSSSEININSAIKKELHNIFLPILLQKESLLPEHGNIFEKAYDHIFKLIEKDSYSRFCKTGLANLEVA